ncbi:MAG: aryl-sulfate sulfotransferase [Ignavibacteriae bacterium]|nr:aryl-sulfate sulfotransferase [Ignavibacteriota bacterium]
MKRLFISLFVLFNFTFFFSTSNAGNLSLVYISPQPDSKDCNLNETIIFSVFEEINPSSINNNLVIVTGNLSGPHPGTLFIAGDKKTLIFKPDTPFSYSETISVEIGTGISTVNGNDIFPHTFSFSTRNQRTVTDFLNLDPNETRIPYQNVDFKLFSPPLDNPESEPTAFVTDNTNPSHGRIFISGFRNDIAYTPYLTIYDNNGTLLFSRATNGPSVDFKKQHNGTFSYFSFVTNKFYVLDSDLALIDSVTPGNGYPTDLHELLITKEGSMFIMSYDTLQIDMSQIVTGGDTSALVAGLVVQELDKNKNVVFQWRSWEEMEITDARYEDFTAERIDYAHGNSIEPDYDGNLIISSRHLDEITKVNRKTGKIMWRLGGKKNEFTFINDDRGFSHQHDVRRVAPGRITLFDNGNYNNPPYSRAVEYELDEVNKTATLVWQFDHNKEVNGFAMGNVQRLSNGNTFIGWGYTQPNVTEVTPLGKIVYEMSLDPGFVSYRSFKQTFNQPDSPYPDDYVLNQNYPNPFNPSTVITFNIPRQTKVSLKVYDILGRVVSVLINSDLSAGEHYAQFNGSNLTSGVYFYNLVTDTYSETKKMILLK